MGRGDINRITNQKRRQEKHKERMKKVADRKRQERAAKK